MEYWRELLIYSPFGIIGVWRWSVWLFQTVMRQRYHTIPPILSDRPRRSLSVVTPVYNEDPDVFERALRSWQANRVDEIIAVIDWSDETCIAIFKRFAEGFPGAKLLIIEEPGKRPALAMGIRAATSDIVALVDSDSLWDRGVTEAVLAPFADDRVGGVATRQAVLDPKTPAERLFAIRLDLRYLHEYPYLASMGNVLTCLSGRTAVYRREALLPLVDGLIHETFLGKRCISGDDKQLTYLLQSAGWLTRFQQNAVVRTPGMPGLKKFFLQNLRWGRNSWRTDLRTMFRSWPWRREPFFAYHLVDRAIQPFTLLLGPIYFGVSLWLGHAVIAALLMGWWLASRTVKLYPHLRENPRDILSVPLFTFSQYYLALIKIYALFTLDFQSWITRWHASRLNLAGLSLVPSRLATASVVIGLAFMVGQHEYAAAEALAERRNRSAIPVTEDFAFLDVAGQDRAFWQEREQHAAVSYVTHLGDTPLSVMRRFNLPAEEVTRLFPGRPRLALIPAGTRIDIPVSSLRIAALPTGIPSLAPAQIAYDAPSRTIRIKGRESTVTLATIARSRAVPTGLLTETAPGEWLLKADLYVGERVTLVLDGQDTRWLKLASGPNGFASLRTHNGNLIIRNTKITSWNEQAGAPDEDVSDGRAYVLAQASGRMDVLGSEIAYLGYSLATEQRIDRSPGGNYGLSWKIPNGTFGQNVLTGVVTGNRIHHNYFGLYTYGASGMVIRDNEVYANLQYGIDPHDDSNNLLIEQNLVHHNGNHGIIVSKRVVYSTIRDNRSTDNRLHGIMLDRQSNANLVEGNFASGNVNGLALYDSHRNLIRRNTFTNNKYGLRANQSSSANLIRDNRLLSNERGVFLYGKASKNVIIDNALTGNAIGVALKEAEANAVANSLRDGLNTLNIKTDEASRTANYVERIL